MSQARTSCVFKFGGSSLANDERIDHVAHLIKDQIKEGYQPRAVVCSAMGKTTNNLLSAGEFALGKLVTHVRSKTDMLSLTHSMNRLCC
jgi:aspartate kinase